MDRSHRNVIGPLVKTQSLYLLSGTSGTRHWDFQSNVNSLVRCNNDEVMRVSLASVNIFNSYLQINEFNNTIQFKKTNDPSTSLATAQIPIGTYTMAQLAEKLNEIFRFHFNVGATQGLTVTYDAGNNAFTIDVSNPFDGSIPTDFYLAGNLNIVLGFSNPELLGKSKYTSDRVPIPHGIAEIVVELFGLTAIEGAAPVSNYESASDDVDYGHTLAVIPAGPVYERTVFYNNSPEFHSFFFSERSVNTLRIALVDRQGQPHTWVKHPVGIGLLFETFKRA